MPDKRCSGSIGELNHPRHFGSRHPVSFLVLMSLRRQICTCLPAPYAQGFCTVVMSPVLTKRCTGTLCWICSSSTRQAPWCCPSAQTRKRHDWVSRAGWLWKSVRHIGTRPKLYYSVHAPRAPCSGSVDPTRTQFECVDLDFYRFIGLPSGCPAVPFVARGHPPKCLIVGERTRSRRKGLRTETEQQPDLLAVSPKEGQEG